MYTGSVDKKRLLESLVRYVALGYNVGVDEWLVSEEMYEGIYIEKKSR